MGQEYCKYANLKAKICDFQFDGNHSVFLYVNISKKFAVQMCITLTLTLKIGQNQMYKRQ